MNGALVITFLIMIGPVPVEVESRQFSSSSMAASDINNYFLLLPDPAHPAQGDGYVYQLRMRVSQPSEYTRLGVFTRISGGNTEQYIIRAWSEFLAITGRTAPETMFLTEPLPITTGDYLGFSFGDGVPMSYSSDTACRDDMTYRVSGQYGAEVGRHVTFIRGHSCRTYTFDADVALQGECIPLELRSSAETTSVSSPYYMYRRHPDLRALDSGNVSTCWKIKCHGDCTINLAVTDYHLHPSYDRLLVYKGEDASGSRIIDVTGQAKYDPSLVQKRIGSNIYVKFYGSDVIGTYEGNNRGFKLSVHAEEYSSPFYGDLSKSMTIGIIVVICAVLVLTVVVVTVVCCKINKECQKKKKHDSVADSEEPSTSDQMPATATAEHSDDDAAFYEDHGGAPDGILAALSRAMSAPSGSGSGRGSGSAKSHDSPRPEKQKSNNAGSGSGKRPSRLAKLFSSEADAETSRDQTKDDTRKKIQKQPVVKVDSAALKAEPAGAWISYCQSGDPGEHNPGFSACSDSEEETSLEDSAPRNTSGSANSSVLSHPSDSSTHQLSDPDHASVSAKPSISSSMLGPPPPVPDKHFSGSMSRPLPTLPDPI